MGDLNVDHRSILLQETNYDYGPVPVQFFHHWIELDGFNNFVVYTWNIVLGDGANGMRNLVCKMKFLKVKIRDWIKSSRVKSKGSIDIYKEDLRELDETIDKGDGSEAIVNKRMKVINSIQCLDQLHAMDVAQKTKIKPISLIGSVYKIIAKILANPLVGVLGDIVNEVQSAFIAERKILDCPFILNEVLQWCKSKKTQSLIFKADFEKTYDSVRRDFLDDVLKKFGFRNKWCNWIQTCLNSSRGSILVNGSPTEEFQFFKGLKQVFVGQWSEENINTLIHVLVCFHRASDLKINLSKSMIIGVHVEGEKVKQVAAKLGCLTLTSPFSYLGTKVGGAMSRVQSWKEVVDKVKYRLSKWKMKALSIGGRLTLLKSVLGSIPIFHMSIFRVPSKVLQAMESLRGHFFNGHEIGSHKATWVKWNNVLAAKDKGGLGTIHGVDGDVNKGNRFAGRSCWSSIMNEVRLLKGRGANIFDFMKLRLGNEETIKFWTDNWGFEQEQFHVLVEVVKSINMVSMEDRWVWNLESSGEFSVSSIRMKIDELRLPRVSYKTRWVKHVPIKVNVFVWKVMVDALPTRFNLSRRCI
nr:hypothetical protein [Tanacetum cinerariifolium]